ncbi:hypothetical protein CERSUDRAFT_72278 [Gelatoporia subvermispora B]|uniref:Protein BFR2 n=1 Tax=Ceriporiopsis subvermispora (strain B) TaxID=914234 RepID=M2QPR2_CERS8|nr:hypothetical protein CERSUDRAFT_72278 [Gelatoporia subvermispora B]
MTAHLDPEDVQAGVFPTDASAADAASGREHYVDVAASTIRKLNESVIDPKYEGIRTSRKALYEDSDEEEPGLEEDEHEDESAPSNSEPESHSELEDDEEARSSGDESQEDSPERRRPSSSHEQSASASALSAHETLKDDDLASTLRKTREEDRQKGKAVSRQIALWDQLLDARIQLQKAATAANRLPAPAYIEAYVSHPSAQDSLQAMLREATALSEELFAFQENLLELNESISAPPRKKRRTDHDSASPSPSEFPDSLREFSESASLLEAAYHAHLVPTLAKWSAKVQAVAPNVLLGAKSAFNRDKAAAGVVSMVDDMLRTDGAKLIARTRTRRGKHGRLAPLSSDALSAPASVSNPDDEDAELFDDTDFYQQLLRDLIKARGGDGAGEHDWMAAQRERKARRKAQVDTKASKGRKIRYEVHPKLQNFMVPVPVSRGDWHEEQIDGLFSSLLVWSSMKSKCAYALGQSARSVENGAFAVGSATSDPFSGPLWKGNKSAIASDHDRTHDLVFFDCMFTESSSGTLPLPPGPKPLPFIGNALDIPALYAWRTYAKWAETYGPVINLRIFGQPFIVLNSAAAVTDLLEKRSSNYSDRMLTEMIYQMGWDWNTALLRYGRYWQRHRRMLHQYLHQTAVQTYDPQQCGMARKLLRRLYAEPEDFAHHIRYIIGANALKIAYGIEAAEKDDDRIAIVERALKGATEGFITGSFWVDILPILKYFPAWLPGAGWKRKAMQWKVDAIATKELPWRDINASESRNTSFTPIAIRLLDRISHLHGEAYREEEEIAKNVAGLIYAVGAETKRAQDQLMSVVGPDRLPEFSDKDSLPYIEAICKECLRWQPALPRGIPHRRLADDKYDNFLIPAGSVVIQNTWAILHDQMKYTDPEEFSPERFLKDGQLHPAIEDPIAAFGSGRRICPGRYLSNRTLFINVAYILHTFDICPLIGPDGYPVLVEPEMTSGTQSYTSSHPRPFKCAIKLRPDISKKLHVDPDHQEI